MEIARFRPRGQLRSLSQAELFHRFQPVVDLALARYDIEDPRYELLHYRDGVTFFVEPLYLLGKYVLRIHNPSHHYQNIWQQSQVIESGLQWLAALEQDTGLTPQKPVSNDAGKYVTEVSPPRHTGDPFRCTLLHWAEGIGGKEMPGRTLAHVRRIGEIMAQMHHHTSHWERPADFVRPKYDAEELEESLGSLRQTVRVGRLAHRDYALFERATRQVVSHIGQLERNDETWGLIHGDLGHRGNCVYFRNEILPIDFNSCLFSFYLLDIAWAFLYIEGAKRQAFLEGYTDVRPLPANYRETIEALYIGAQITLLSRFAEEEDTSLDYAHRFAAKECSAYLQGQPFVTRSAWWEA